MRWQRKTIVVVVLAAVTATVVVVIEAVTELHSVQESGSGSPSVGSQSAEPDPNEHISGRGVRR